MEKWPDGHFILSFGNKVLCVTFLRTGSTELVQMCQHL